VKKLLLEAEIIENSVVIPQVRRMQLRAPEIAAIVQPGQFVQVRKKESTVFLRRPFSIADANTEKGTICIMYRVVGKGSAEMAAMNPGERISVEGPLGTGFSLGEGRPLFVGGGVGIAPLIFLTKRLQQKKPIVLIGGKNKEETFWTKYLEEYADKIYITTDDGSVGQKGFTIQAIPDLLEKNSIDRIAACGPMIMMKGVAEIAARYKKECEVSMEKRMACGIGVCLGCTFEGKITGRRLKVCSDGPVFPAKEVF